MYHQPSEKAEGLTTIIDFGLSESFVAIVEKREPASSISDQNPLC